MRRAAGHGGLDPLLVSPMAELDQALIVEPDPGNPPLLGGPDQRHRAGAERSALGKPDELVALCGKVEPRWYRSLRAKLGREQRVQQGEREPPRLDPHLLLLVLVDHVVMPPRVRASGSFRR